MSEPLNLIYGLVDPRTGVIRYVGQSTRGLKRPREHWQHTSTKDKSHRAKWIRLLKREGLRYEIVVLQYLRDDQSYEDIDAVECWWIAYGRSQGWNLTNTTDGGGGIHGYTHTQEHRQHVSKVATAYWADPAHRAKQSARQSLHMRGNTYAKALRGRKRSWVTNYRVSLAQRRRHQGPVIRINLLPKSEP